MNLTAVVNQNALVGPATRRMDDDSGGFNKWNSENRAAVGALVASIDEAHRGPLLCLPTRCTRPDRPFTPDAASGKHLAGNRDSRGPALAGRRAIGHHVRSGDDLSCSVAGGCRFSDEIFAAA